MLLEWTILLTDYFFASQVSQGNIARHSFIRSFYFNKQNIKTHKKTGGGEGKRADKLTLKGIPNRKRGSEYLEYQQYTDKYLCIFCVTESFSDIEKKKKVTVTPRAGKPIPRNNQTTQKPPQAAEWENGWDVQQPRNLLPSSLHTQPPQCREQFSNK